MSSSESSGLIGNPGISSKQTSSFRVASKGSVSPGMKRSCLSHLLAMSGVVKGKIPTMTEFSFDLFITPVSVKFISKFPK